MSARSNCAKSRTVEMRPLDGVRVVAEYCDGEAAPLPIHCVRRGKTLEHPCVTLDRGRGGNAVGEQLRVDDVRAGHRVDHGQPVEQVRERFAERVVGAGSDGAAQRLEPLRPVVEGSGFRADETRTCRIVAPASGLSGEN